MVISFNVIVEVEQCIKVWRKKTTTQIYFEKALVLHVLTKTILFLHNIIQKEAFIETSIYLAGMVR
jgi:hypothetical protein